MKLTHTPPEDLYASAGCGRAVRVDEYRDDPWGEVRFVGHRNATCGRDATCDDCARADLEIGGRAW